MSKGLQRPPFGVVTTMNFDDDVNYSKLEFECAGTLDDKYAEGIMKQRELISEDLRAEFNPENYTAPEKRSKFSR